MALTSNTCAEVRNGGSDTNNSGFFRGGLCQLARPVAPTVTGAGTGGTVAAGTYYVVVTYFDAYGETRYSPETSVVLTGTTSKFTVTAPTRPDYSTTWNVYAGTVSGGPYFPQTLANAFGTDLVRTTTPATTGTGPPGVNRTLQTTVQMALDNSTITATTAGANSNVITFTGYTPTADDVANTYRSLTGTNINTGLFEVLNFTASPATWTVSTNTAGLNLTTAGGAGSAMTGNMGGCFATIGQAGAFHADNNAVAVKYNAAVQTMSASANVAGGKFAPSNGGTIFSYDTNRHPWNTDANRQVVQPSANSMKCINPSGSNGLFIGNFVLSNPGNNTAWTAIETGGRGTVWNCDVSGTTSNGFGITAAANTTIENCYLHDNAGTCITGPDATTIINCAIDNVTGAGVGVNFSGQSIATIRNLAISNFNSTGAAISLSTAAAFVDGLSVHCTNASNTVLVSTSSTPAGRAYHFSNMILWGGGGNFNLIGGNGITGSTPSADHTITNCFFGNYGTASPVDQSWPQDQQRSNVLLTAIPWTDAPNKDMSINNVAGGGALVRGAGSPQTFPGGFTVSRPDGGAAQHVEAAAGATNYAFA